MTTYTKVHHGQRFREICEEMQIRPVEFPELFGFSRRNGYYLFEQAKIKRSKLIELADALNISVESFNSDKFAIIPKNEPPPQQVQTAVTQPTRKGNIIYVPLKAQAGYLDNFLGAVMSEEAETHSLPNLPENEKYFMFQAEGNSMEPLISDGDLIICQQLENIFLLKNNKVYLVVTKTDGMSVKRVENQIENKRRLRLKSDNPDIKPYYVPVEDVRQIWEVKKVVADVN